MSSSRHISLVRYRYDSLDRLVDRAPGDQPVQQSFYQKNALACEIHGQIHHSYFQQPDMLLAQQQHHGAIHETTFLASDAKRSVLHALGNGQREAIAYAPYGHRSEGGLFSLLGFNGERTDSVTGHYLLGNGYRAFNPVLMRFNSPDSMSPFGKGGLNAYAYCAGDPVNSADPTGHSPVKFGILFGVGSALLFGSVVTKNDTASIAMAVGGVAIWLSGPAFVVIRARMTSGGRASAADARFWATRRGARPDLPPPYDSVTQSRQAGSIDRSWMELTDRSPPVSQSRGTLAQSDGIGQSSFQVAASDGLPTFREAELLASPQRVNLERSLSISSFRKADVLASPERAKRVRSSSI